MLGLRKTVSLILWFGVKSVDFNLFWFTAIIVNLLHLHIDDIAAYFSGRVDAQSNERSRRPKYVDIPFKAPQMAGDSVLYLILAACTMYSGRTSDILA